MLIQCLASLFCFVLLIHKGMGLQDETAIEVERTLEIENAISHCKSKLSEFFKILEPGKRLQFGMGFPLSYYFIPDNDLISILASLQIPDRRFAGHVDPHNQRQTHAIIQSHVDFGTEGPGSDSVQFVVQHPDGRRGIAKFVAKSFKGEDNAINEFKNKIGSNNLPCFEYLNEANSYHDRAMLPTNHGNGIEIHLFGYVYEMFDAELVLSSLIKLKPTGRPSWIATEAMLIGGIMILKDKSGKGLAQGPLPKGRGVNKVDIEYIQAAINIVNVYKRGMTYYSNFKTRGEGHVLTWDW